MCNNYVGMPHVFFALWLLLIKYFHGFGWCSLPHLSFGEGRCCFPPSLLSPLLPRLEWCCFSSPPSSGGAALYPPPLAWRCSLRPSFGWCCLPHLLLWWCCFRPLLLWDGAASLRLLLVVLFARLLPCEWCLRSPPTSFLNVVHAFFLPPPSSLFWSGAAPFSPSFRIVLTSSACFSFGWCCRSPLSLGWCSFFAFSFQVGETLEKERRPNQQRNLPLLN